MSFHSRRRPFAESKPEDKAGDGLWEAYLDAVDAEDQASVESWNGSTTGILTFTGLFAATVATFVIESYRTLTPDSGAQTVALLAQLVSLTNSTPVVSASDISHGPSRPPETAILINSLWFFSLVIALICALLATLIQEWTRDFLRDVRHRTSDMTIKEYAFNHIYVRMGIERYGLDNMATLIVALMHMAVVLFLIGLTVFLFPIHTTPAAVVTTAASIAALVYVSISAIPLFDNTCPYRTPLSSLFAIMHTSFRLSKLALTRPSKVMRLVSTHPHYRTNELWQLWRLPARRIYHDLPANLRTLFLDDRSIAQMTFMKHARMIFVWQRTSGYMLATRGRSVLLEYLPLQLLKPDSHDFDKLWVYLRSRRSFFSSIIRSMTEVHTPSGGKGALRLLQMILHAECRVETRSYLNRSTSAPHVSSWYQDGIESLAPIFPRIIRQFDKFVGILSDDEHLDMVVAFTSFRWSILQISVTKSSLWRSLLYNIDTIHGLRLLPLSREDRWISEIDSDFKILKSPNSDFVVLQDLHDQQFAARNALTLLAHIVFSQWPLETPHLWRWINPDFPYVKDSSPGTWTWYKIFPPDHSIAARPHASAVFLTLLQHAGLGAWRDPNVTNLVVPRGVQLHPSTVVVLRNLLDLVSLPPLSDQVLLSDDELESLGLVIPHPNRQSTSHAFASSLNNAQDTHHSQRSYGDVPRRLTVQSGRAYEDMSAPIASGSEWIVEEPALSNVEQGTISLHDVTVTSSPPEDMIETIPSEGPRHGIELQMLGSQPEGITVAPDTPSPSNIKRQRVLEPPRGPRRRSPGSLAAPFVLEESPPSSGTGRAASEQGMYDHSGQRGREGIMLRDLTCT